MEEDMELECVKEAIDVRESEDMPLKQLNDDDRPNREHVNGNGKLNAEHVNDNGRANAEHVNDNGKPDAKHVDMNKHTPIGNEDEGTHEELEDLDIEMEEACDGEEVTEYDTDDSLIDDLQDEDPLSFQENNSDSSDEVSLTDAEIEELVMELLELESKAAEAQEALELESLKKVEDEVRVELAQTLQGDELENAVTEEMEAFVEQWKVALDDLETQGSLLLEQLDGAGVELPKLYKWIESQAPNVCGTEAWKKRAHWAGSEATLEVNAAVANAEKHLQCCRPVKTKHGKLLEEGAGGFLVKKLAGSENGGTCHEHSFKDWASFNEHLQSSKNSITNGFGSKNWASVYLASTPQQAAEMGLTFPGVDEVEEIDEIQIDADHPFYADAIANEKDIDLSEEQRKKFKKIREEEDAKFTKKLQNHLKRRRWKKLQNQNPCNDFDSNCPTISVGKEDSEDGDLCHASITEKKLKSSALVGSELNEKSVDNGVVHADTETRLQSCSEEMNIAQKRNAVIVDSDDEAQPVIESAGNISSQQIIHVQTLNQAKEICDVTHVDSFCETPNNFHCTACFTLLQASKVQKHPLLEVIVCENCKFMIKEKMENVVTDNAESYCKWCGRCKDLVNCVSCKSLFCRTCIKRNLGDGQLLEMKASTWQCCCCSPAVLKKLIMDWNIAYNGVVLSSSGSDSELVGSDFDISPRKKKRRKKRIRRIIDDDELGEETRQKIEIEKARQEHLNSMKYSGQWGKNEESSMSMEESASPDILGDASNGYIVNVAREEDEEPVRIPPSVSSKLKPHQVSGIRFMWENIIQSVGKIRSGDKGLGCILAHTMGLGKTFQVIAFLYSALRSTDLGLKTALIVTPVNVLHNWRQEFFKWRPVDVKALRVFMVEDVPRDKRAHLLSKWRSKGGVLLIGYASFRNLSFGKHLKDRNIAAEICDSLQNGPDILICDEAHIIKNARADTTQALKRVRTQRRIALTGSPLQNNLMEYYCMVDFVREGFLGSSHEFRNRFQNPIENGQHTNSTRDDVKIMNQRSHILYKQLKGFVQRVDMNVMKKDLPPKTVYVVSVKLSPLQKKLYKKFLDVHGFTDKMSCSDKAAAKRCFFAGYQALAQIWNHPGLLQMTKGHRDNLIREDVVDNFLGDTSSDDNKEHTCLPAGESHLVKNAFFANKKSDEINFHEEADWWRELLDEKIYNQVDFSGKMVLLIDILSMSSEIGDKALVFSQSLSTLDLIELFLSKLKRKEKDHKYWKQGKDWYRLDGSTKGSERQKLVERFNDPNNKRAKCTLISTRAGSLGINLYAANRVIIVDGSWNPTHDLQAIHRVWRYGQMKPVFAYRLMAHGTMEEKIYKRQVTKEGLAARVMDRQQIHRTMSKEEMLHLFDFGDDENVEAFVDENQEEKPRVNMEKTSGLTDLLKQKSLSLSDGVGLSDKIMEDLLNRYYPRWIKDCHEHETLLQENEDEKLSKEEQDIAWETFWRSIEWEEAHKVVPSDNPSFEQKPPRHLTSISESIQVQQNKNSVRSQSTHSVRSQTEHGVRNQTEHSVKIQPAPTRKCSNLSHLLTLRSRGTKSGSSTTCGECSQEISWENLSRDGKPR